MHLRCSTLVSLSLHASSAALYASQRSLLRALAQSRGLGGGALAAGGGGGPRPPPAHLALALLDILVEGFATRLVLRLGAVHGLRAWLRVRAGSSVICGSGDGKCRGGEGRE